MAPPAERANPINWHDNYLFWKVARYVIGKNAAALSDDFLRDRAKMMRLDLTPEANRAKGCRRSAIYFEPIAHRARLAGRRAGRDRFCFRQRRFVRRFRLDSERVVFVDAS